MGNKIYKSWIQRKKLKSIPKNENGKDDYRYKNIKLSSPQEYGTCESIFETITYGTLEEYDTQESIDENISDYSREECVTLNRPPTRGLHHSLDVYRKFDSIHETITSGTLEEYGSDESLNEIIHDYSQEEDGQDDSIHEHMTHDSQEENDTDDICKKENESNHFYGTHETQVSEGGEADLHKHFDNCTKKQGHIKFVPVNDFNINHLPEGHHDDELVEYIKVAAKLTVRVGVKMTSTERPQLWPNTNQSYPFNDKRGSDVMRLGTGMMCDVNRWTEEDIKKRKNDTCLCHKCQQSDKPRKVWGSVTMCTATHVVFDDIEAKHTSCRLFFDRQDSPLVTLDGWKVWSANIEEDWCVLECLTCDVNLLDELDKMSRHWRDLCYKVSNTYFSSRDKVKMSFIVSHPHGCLKQISVGQWINRYKVSKLLNMTKYTYTTCTCPGSSGAHVHSLGYNGALYYDRHVHSGVNSQGLNYSGTGRDWR